MTGGTWDGYTRKSTSAAEDAKPVSEELQGLWPPGTFDAAGPGHEVHPPRTQVYEAPKPGQKKRKKRKVPGGQP